MTRRANGNVCTDHRGRHGVRRTQSTGGSATGIYMGVDIQYCHVYDQTPQRDGDVWKCNETYELQGVRFSWPDGRIHIEPEKCAPI